MQRLFALMLALVWVVLLAVLNACDTQPGAVYRATPERSYRIPVIVTDGAALVLFAESRPGPSDNGDIDTVARVSLDGATWGPVTTVCDTDGVCGNPVPIVDGDSIHLLSTRNPISDQHARTVHYSAWRRAGSVLLPVKPWRQLPPERVQAPGTRWDATGPAPGLVSYRSGAKQLLAPATGRLLVSDDSGESWRAEYVPGPTGESGIAEFQGRLIRYARQVEGSGERFEHMLAEAVWRGSWVWSAHRYVPDLPTPGHYCSECSETARTCHCGRVLFVQAALAATSTHILFSSPASTRSRRDLVLYRSTGSIQRWEPVQVVKRGNTGYSSIAASRGYAYVAYEAPDMDMHHSVYVRRVRLQDDSDAGFSQLSTQPGGAAAGQKH